MNLKAIEGALKSNKTPSHLKKGLLKKYGHLFPKLKSYGALASTVQANPKEEEPSEDVINRIRKMSGCTRTEAIQYWKSLYKKNPGRFDSKQNKDIKDIKVGDTISISGIKVKVIEVNASGLTIKPAGYRNIEIRWEELANLNWRKINKNPAKKRPNEGDIISIPRFGTFMVIKTYARGLDLQSTKTGKQISLTWEQLQASNYKIISKG